MPSESDPSPRALLAVDLGLKTGLAYYGGDGRLLWYRSHNLGNRQRLKRAAYSLLSEYDGVTHLAVEGGGPLVEPWKKEADRRGLRFLRVDAETWRQALLTPSEMRLPSAKLKIRADHLARSAIDWSGAPRPTSLRHDAAEAVLRGLYAAVRFGWLDRIPAEVR
jgi:hypothetical protein